MTLFLYQVCYITLLPLILIIQLLRKDLRSRLWHFYGFFREENWGRFPANQSQWFHAVSFGETLILVRFIQIGLDSGALKGDIFFTTTIENALRTFQRAFRDHKHEKQIFTAFLPLDFLPILTLFINRVKPSRFFLAETDFWPMLLWLLHRKKVPSYAVNVRISESLHYWYSHFPKLSRPLFSGFQNIFAQSETDLKRLRDFSDTNLLKFGNAKFDLLEAKGLAENLAWLKNCPRQIICFGSFHRDEFPVIYEARQQHSTHDSIFLVAPRDLNHLQQLQNDIQSLGWSHEKLSTPLSEPGRSDFILVDRMGLLASLYAVCHLAVIGGSFNNAGGHNPLEPMVYRRPVIVGPGMRNYQDVVDDCISRQLIWQVSGCDELLNLMQQYLNNPKPFIEGSLKAYQYLKQNQGTLKKIWEVIEADELT